MVCKIEGINQKNMGALLAHGLGARSREDPMLAKYACIALRVCLWLVKSYI